MLVIISDVHLTDGSSGETVHQGTLRAFRERLRNLVYAASWRADGKYRPIEELNLVLLGDFLDVLRSSKWLEGNDGGPSGVRPWDAPQTGALAEKVAAITDGILKRNRVFFALLRELHSTAIASVPPATPHGGSSAGAAAQACARVPVRVRVHYMVGNHDWFYHLPHSAYGQIRRRIVGALGLENNPELPFPHDAEEPAAGAVRRVLDEHRVCARHGDIYDPFNCTGDRDSPALGDAVVIDLVTRFAAEVRSQLGDELPPECLDGFREIDNVRPLMLVPVWVGGLLRRACPDPKLHRQVQEIWSGLADGFLRLPFVRDQLSVRHPLSSVEKLRWALGASKRLLSPECSRLLCWMVGRFGSRKKSYYPYALREKWFKNRRARFVVYGHTHHHEIVPLDSCFSVRGAVHQIYLNSGTWRPVHELARLDPGREAFAAFNTMTYLAFFKDDERGGRTFECWSGGLSNLSAMRENGASDR
ncbi:MAG: hypothetical protein ACRD1N_01215 [Terriglobia bacterium]